jgi:hypothetical protein
VPRRQTQRLLDGLAGGPRHQQVVGEQHRLFHQQICPPLGGRGGGDLVFHALGGPEDTARF